MGTLSRSWSRERCPNLTMYALSIASLEQRSGQNIMIEVEVSRNSGNILLIYDDKNLSSPVSLCHNITFAGFASFEYIEE